METRTGWRRRLAALLLAVVLLVLIMLVTFIQKRVEKWLDDRDSRTPRAVVKADPNTAAQAASARPAHAE